MKIYLAALLILSCYISSTFAVSDANICATSCQYCCRNQQCQSKSTCQGNYEPFIILGGIAGGLIALFIARRVYVHYRNKNLIARGIDPKAQNKDKQGFRSRWRSRRGKSADKDKKEKKERRDKKEKKEKAKSVKSVKSVKSLKSLKDADENPNKSKGDIYLQIDNESVLSAEDVKTVKNKNSGQISSRQELKPGSKNEILVKSDTNLNDKDRLNPYKQNKIPDMPSKDKGDKENKKKDDKARSSSKGKSTDKSKKSAMTGSMKDSKMDKSATGKERGRSKEPGGEKKKSTSTGPKGEKSRGASEKTRKNQI